MKLEGQISSVREAHQAQLTLVRPFTNTYKAGNIAKRLYTLSFCFLTFHLRRVALGVSMEVVNKISLVLFQITKK